jgi:predicted nucleotidyltransferase
MGVLWMNHRSRELIDLTKQFLELTVLNETVASIDGSTARGNADQYSDIDLTINGGSKQQCDKNIEFSGVTSPYFSLSSRRLVQPHRALA